MSDRSTSPICAIYSRKSSAQHVSDDARSVVRQIENAKKFAAAQGWRVDDRHVFCDDGISGAETTKLRGKQRLLELAASPACPFDIVILQAPDRFSRRSGAEALVELKQLARRCEVWFYADGRRFDHEDTFQNNTLGFLQGEFAAEFRRAIARKTREAMVKKAEAGHVCGGKVFGYDNVRVDGHVDRAINAQHAEVIRRIFSMSANGSGYTKIAKTLNAARALAPRAQQQWPTGWSPSSVREVLFRDLYRGVLVWNKTQKRDQSGQRDQRPRPETEWLRLDRPDLRIVSDRDWEAAHQRLRSPRIPRDTHGRRPRQLESPYLLSGHGRCSTCGGAISVLSRAHGKQRRRVYVYGCLTHAKRGKTICPNAVVLPLDRVDTAVIDALTRDVLRPAVVRALLDSVFDALAPRTVTANVTGLRSELRALDAKVAHLTAAIESGAALAPIVAQLQTRQAERETVVSAIAAADAVAQLDLDRRDIERKVLAKVEHWRALLDSDHANRRQFLREALDGPIAFTPEGKTYRFAGVTATGALIDALVGGSTMCGVPNGIRTRVLALKVKKSRIRPLSDRHGKNAASSAAGASKGASIVSLGIRLNHALNPTDRHKNRHSAGRSILGPGT